MGFFLPCFFPHGAITEEFFFQLPEFVIFPLQEINILCSENQLRVLQNFFLYLNYQHTPSISTSRWQFLFPDNFCFSGFFPKITISYFLHQQGCCRVDSPGFWSCQGAASRWAVFIAALSHRGSPGWPRGLAVLALTVGLCRAVPLQGLGVALPVPQLAQSPSCPSSLASVCQDSVCDLGCSTITRPWCLFKRSGAK